MDEVKTPLWEKIDGMIAFATIIVFVACITTALSIARNAGISIPLPTPEEVVLREFDWAHLGFAFGAAAVTALGTHIAQRSNERRTVKRHKCRLRCQADFYGSTLRCVLLDVSERGAQLKVKSFVLRPDEEITIRVGDLSLIARVVWSKDGRSGVEYTDELPYDAFRYLLNRIRKRNRERQKEMAANIT